MGSSGKRRGKTRRHVGHVGAGVGATVTIIVSSDGKAEVSGKLADLSDWGVGVETETPLAVDKLVTVACRFLAGDSAKKEKRLARVVHTRCAGEQLYRSGLAFEGASNGNGNEKRETVPDVSMLDHYEILQVSPHADTDTIQRVYRLLAQRYHPDNTDTGNEEMFRGCCRPIASSAIPKSGRRTTLSTAPAGRCGGGSSMRPTPFRQPTRNSGPAAESCRSSTRIDCSNPLEPASPLRELESLLACPREHLDFSLWYLKAKGLIQSEDNARFSITAEGVDEFRFRRPAPPDLRKALPPGQEEASR